MASTGSASENISHTVTIKSFSSPTAIPWWIAHGDNLFNWAVVSFVFYLISAIIFPFLPLVLILLKVYTRASGILILHLVLLEAILAVVLVPLQMMGNYVAQYNIFKPIDCVHIKFIFQVFMQTANWSQLFLGSNRLIAATSRQMYARCSTTTAVVATIGISWLIGIVDTVPTVLNIEGNYVVAPPWNNCIFQPKPLTPWIHYLIVGIYIPLPLTVAVYISLMVRFWMSRQSAIGAVEVNSPSAALEASRKRRLRTGGCCVPPRYGIAYATAL
ncbi:uncharacterized protein LOC129589953 [Paramacrobiotus metropolitanus]|uniref:uncharacterized protein LOC129589953 n=1 Tax=Paramacrobiotus metropolitanus TaxID=2943436 RepID=UPI002445F8F8|nr:uncharacterized protein LOC129589953 [Paramacrobiotus metropolitanus]